MESRISCSFGSIRVTVPTSGLVTHTASADAATDPGRSSSPTVAVTSPDSGSRTPIEFGSISELPPALRATSGTATNAATTANATTAATALHRARGGGAIDRTNGAIASGVVPVLGTHRDHMDRLLEPLQLRLATLGEPDAVDP